MQKYISQHAKTKIRSQCHTLKAFEAFKKEKKENGIIIMEEKRRFSSLLQNFGSLWNPLCLIEITINMTKKGKERKGKKTSR